VRIRTVSSNVAYLEQNDSVLKCNCVASSTAVYLNPSRDYQENATIIKVDSSTNVVTVYPHGSETIDGAASVALTTENDTKVLMPVEGGWSVSINSYAQLADIVQKMPYGEFVIPSDMPAKLPFKVRRDIDNVVRHNADFTQFTGSGHEYFVDTELGNDANDGLTIGTAFKALGKAIQTAINHAEIGLFKIKIKGFVEDGDGMLGCGTNRWEVPKNKTIAISSYTGQKVYVSTGGKQARYNGQWTVNSNISYLGVLDKEFTSVYDSSKMDAYGINPPLKRVTTLAECQANLDTFYSLPVAKGGGLWVNSRTSKPVNLFNPVTVHLDTTINSSGAETPEATYHSITSDWIPVDGNVIYTLTRAANNAVNISWYDINQAFISRVLPAQNSPAITTGAELQATAPANAKFAKIVTYPNSFPDWATTVMFVGAINTSHLWVVSGKLLTTSTSKYGSNLAINLAAGSKVYFQDIIFLSGDLSNLSNTDLGAYPGCVTCSGTLDANSKNEVWAKDCYFIGGARGGIDASGYWNKTTDSVGGFLTRETNAYTFNCIAAYNGTDALSYGADPTYRNHMAFEYQNIAYQTLGGTTANASTCHNFFNRISIGCVYSDASGPVIADANGCYSICIDCHCKNASVGYNPISTMSLFHSDLPQANSDAWGRRGKMILINCTAYGSGYNALNCDGVVDVYIFNFVTNKNIETDLPAQKYVFS